jgi:hypothetical protein
MAVSLQNEGYPVLLIDGYLCQYYEEKKREGQMKKIPTKILLALLGALLVGLILPCGLSAFQREESSLKDFDIRFEPGIQFMRPTSAQFEALAKIRTKMDGDLRITWNKLSATPRHLFNRRGYLTPPSQNDPEQIALDFIRQNNALFRFSQEDLNNLVLKKRYTSKHNGVTHLLFHQHFQEIEIFQAEVRVNIDRVGRIINVGGNSYPGILVPLTPKMPVQEAVRKAATNINPSLDFEPLLVRPFRLPKQRAVLRGGAFSRDITGGLTIFPMGIKATLAWEVIIPEPETPNVYQILVDADSGEILFRYNLTRYFAHGLVYEENPGASLPPFTGERVEISFEGDAVTSNPDVSPIGWVFDTQTSGNNVTAGEDKDCDEEGTPASDPEQAFDFPIDLSLDPLVYTDASVTNLFWQNNFMHDFLYELGFDESSGNFQEDNFGRGGLGSDSINALAQLGCFPNNAFFYCPSDGNTPIMGMGIFSYTRPRRDSALDGDIILHEYSHGLSGRLVGALPGTQSGALGEGWSDWFPAVIYDPDDGTDRSVMGEYLTGLPDGIRRYPYSRDMAVNPLTYSDLCQGPGGCEVHDDGEIWAVTLWGLYKDLVDAYGLDPDNLPYPIDPPYDGREKAYLLVVDGMKLSPLNPSMLEARNAILLADQTNNSGANECLIWKAFARRGMGYSACSGVGCSPGEGGSGRDSSVTEAFDLPPQCLDGCTEDDSGALDIEGTIYGSPGSTVVIPVRIQNAPNQVTSFGFDLAYNTSILEYAEYSRGDCVTNFDYFDVNEREPGLLVVGGFEAGPHVIPQGANCVVVELKFNVRECVPGNVYPLGDLQNLVDDIAGWSASGACFQCGCTCDVNGDGEVTPQDALCAFQKYLGICPTSCGPCEDICCDVNGDGQCTPADALESFKEYLGIVPNACTPE